MAWGSLAVSPDGTHHVDRDRPAYHERFDRVLPFHTPGLAPVQRAGEAWHIDALGRPAYEPRFVRAFGFYEGRAAVVGADGWHHITPDGRALTSDRYTWCGNFQGGRCTVRRRDGRYVHLDSNGVPICQTAWRYAGDFREGVAVAQGEDGRSTHLDELGKPLHGCWFADLDVFHKGLARARDHAGWFHVDRLGRPVYERRFVMVEPFYNGQARVERHDGGLEVIDESGSQLVELRCGRPDADALSADVTEERPHTPAVATELGAIEYVIPPSTLRWIETAPTDRPVALLIRHSVRGELPAGDAGYTLPITDVGVRLAEDLGRALGPRLRSLHASPLTRCVQTAEAVARGAGAATEVRRDHLLGDHGAFVLDGRLAWSEGWARLGHEGVMAKLVAGVESLPGMANADRAARFLVQHLLAASRTPGIHVFCTHDSIVTATAARSVGVALGPDAWPWYLEAAALWPSERGVEVRYRDHSATMPTPLCGLGEDDVLELARREILGLVGSTCTARFYLAGGAFKSLLHGRPPRDLDLWAASAEERAELVRALAARGARLAEHARFSDVFELRDRRIDVPHKTDAPTVEDRLARFDLALSAVGVEHASGPTWRAVIDERALADVRTRTVRFLKPLANWRHALSSLARARRYADELGYVLPRDEVAEVWRVFDAQDREMRLGMIERLVATGRDDAGVADEARDRMTSRVSAEASG